jgi:hypothetical protein
MRQPRDDGGPVVGRVGGAAAALFARPAGAYATAVIDELPDEQGEPLLTTQWNSAPVRAQA